MNNKYFIDKTKYALPENMVGYKKRQKIKKSNIFIKIIPMLAVVMLVIGLVNLLPMIMKNESVEEDVVEPILNIDWSVLDNINKIELFVPEIVEKSFFESKILATMKNKRAYNQINSYYKLQNGFYTLDPNISDREKDNLLNYYNQYTDLTGNDIVRMYRNNGISYNPKPADFFDHVRFGKTKDILLLDVEWHTPETYMEEVIEPYKNQIEQNNGSVNEEYFNYVDTNLKDIENGKLYIPRSVNGKKGIAHFALSFPNKNLGISTVLDADGYYIFNIYPYVITVSYYDETGEFQCKNFGTDEKAQRVSVNSKKEYDRLLKNEIIPFCDDLIARGLITSEQYDEFTIADPLDKYVEMYFN